MVFMDVDGLGWCGMRCPNTGEADLPRKDRTGLEVPGSGGLDWGFSVDADQAIEEPVEGLAAGDEEVGVAALLRLGEGVEETPGIAGTEFLMRGSPPFLQDLRHLGGGDGPAVDRLDDEIVGLRIGQRPLPVGQDALVELAEPVTELAHGPRGEVPQVADREAGVLPRDPHLAGKGEIVTTQDGRPGDQAGRIGLVMAVADPDDPTVFLFGPIGQTDLEDTEVAGTSVAEGVTLSLEGETRGLQLTLDLGDEVPVRKRIPGVGGSRCGCLEDVLPGDGFCAAVK